MEARSGLFVSVDGPSGVGKKTVSRALSELLIAEGHAVTLTTTPSSSEIGRLARSGTYRIHGTALACLVASDRYYHYEHAIAPALTRSEIVLCDRWVPSSLVLDFIDGVERDFAWNIYSQIAVPDIAVILIGDPFLCDARSRTRGVYSRFHSRSVEDNIRERDEYLMTVSYLQARHYPIHMHQIKGEDASQIAQSLACMIRDTLRAAR